MANLESKLVVTDLDFDNIKANLKDFMRSQDTFSDYDFEGSGLSSLIDLLAYNTHYMGFYANMIANESFLDTASIRNSVISHAKMLGYTPYSVKSSVARINLSFSDESSSTSLTLPKYTKFASASLDGVNYIFTNLEEYTVDKSSNEYKFINLDLTEGTPISYVYAYNELVNPLAEFNINDSGVDTSTIEIIVQNSSVDLTRTVFTQSKDSTVVDETSTVYFIDETKDQKYKIYFGNGILGKKLSDGNIVIINYILSKGAASNRATNLTLTDTVRNALGTSLIGKVTMIQSAAGGAVAETIENIKFAAPKSYISNNRAVTKNDYIALIQKNYPSLDAVNVWGGEENNPPVYGKIYISAKPALGYELTLTEKQRIIDEVINPISIVTVTPEFVSPDYVFLNLNVTVDYDKNKTTRTPGQIISLVKSSIYNFANTNLNTFNSNFKMSRLMRDIDNSDVSILSNQINISLEKRIQPVLGYSRNYSLNFNTALKRSVGRYKISSSPAYTAYDSEDTYRRFYFEEEPLSFTGVYTVNVLYGGSGGVKSYPCAPTLEVIGDGYGAQVTAILTNGKVTAVTVDKPGSEYTTAEIVAYDQDGNVITELSFEVIINNAIGNLRTYFLNDNKVKQIYSTNAGTINYTTGEIKLNNFAPVDIESDLKVLRFFAEPENLLFKSEKNCIITLDVEDTASVTIKAKQIAS